VKTKQQCTQKQSYRTQPLLPETEATHVSTNDIHRCIHKHYFSDM